MTPHSGLPHSGDEPPSPELLAAYIDGECEGRDDLALLKQRIEAWLAAHPEARVELASYRRLLQGWQETTPPDPDPTRWSAMLDRLQAVSILAACRPVAPHRSGQLRTAAIAGVVALSIVFALFFWPRDERPVPLAPVTVLVKQAPVEETEDIFEVATASEVAIIRVEGEDTQTLVVGELPVHGTLELVKDGDVILTNVRPDAEDSMLPEVRMSARSTPFIWARLDSEYDEP